jgi:hypothetical protein
MAKRTLLAIFLGVLATAALIGLAAVAYSADLDGLAQVLFWQNSLLQSLAPLGNIGTAEHPIYEGTPLNFLAFLASIPVGIVVYSSMAYWALSRSRRAA